MKVINNKSGAKMKKNNFTNYYLYILLILISYNNLQAQCPSIEDVLDHGYLETCPNKTLNNRDEFAVVDSEPFIIKFNGIKKLLMKYQSIWVHLLMLSSGRRI